jgi:catechol 2,3-dioxygenase-like lactoylglutathione lyase family enzyme
MNVTQAVPFFWVHDMDRALQFYVEGLGFTLKKRWQPDGKIRWCWLDRDEASIMLQEFWREGPHRNAPDGPLGVGVTICFVCKDAIALYHEFTGRGVGASVPQVGNGMWVTSLRDPDGYSLLFESVTDAPEESTYRSEMTTPSPSNRI